MRSAGIFSLDPLKNYGIHMRGISSTHADFFLVDSAERTLCCIKRVLHNASIGYPLTLKKSLKVPGIFGNNQHSLQNHDLPAT